MSVPADDLAESVTSRRLRKEYSELAPILYRYFSQCTAADSESSTSDASRKFQNLASHLQGCISAMTFGALESILLTRLGGRVVFSCSTLYSAFRLSLREDGVRSGFNSLTVFVCRIHRCGVFVSMSLVDSDFDPHSFNPQRFFISIQRFDYPKRRIMLKFSVKHETVKFTLLVSPRTRVWADGLATASQHAGGSTTAATQLAAAAAATAAVERGAADTDVTAAAAAAHVGRSAAAQTVAAAYFFFFFF